MGARAFPLTKSVPQRYTGRASRPVACCPRVSVETSTSRGERTRGPPGTSGARPWRVLTGIYDARRTAAIIGTVSPVTRAISS